MDFLPDGHGPGEGPQPWRNLSDDLADPAILGAWVEQMRTGFAAGLGVSPDDVDERATRSVLHLGLCARLLSPWLGLCAYGYDARPPVWSALQWRPDGTTRFALGSPGFSDHQQAWAADIMQRIVEPLNAVGLVTSPPIVQGNVASTINGAVSAIGTLGPAQRQAAQDVGQELCEAAGVPFDGSLGEPTFRRRSCCLMNSLTPATREAICGDCIHQPMLTDDL